MIKLFSASTCERIGELYGHTDTVTSVIVNPHNRMQILSSSYDGTVRVWDFYEGSCLETYQIGSPILNFVMTDRNTLYLNIDGKLSSRKQHQSCRVIKYNTKSNKSFPCYKSRACRGLVRSPCGSFLASISKNTLFIWNIKAEKLVKHKHTNTLTSIAFSPSAGKYIATGDSEGKIIRWFRCFDDGGNVVRTTLHWHAHAVHSLAFSEDGSYLLSGGEEAVFVLWQVDTNHKQFIPRLGSTISHISVSNDGKSYALACADNTVRIIDAITSKVLKTVVGLQYAHSHLIMNKSSSSSSSTDSSSSVVTSTHKSLLKSLIIEPRHNLIVLEGMPGTLQFYDVFTDRHVMHVDVVSTSLAFSYPTHQAFHAHISASARSCLPTPQR